MKITNGNKKIGKDTLILNITSATDCPSKALGLCKHTKICYAMKAERMYPACLPFRRAQTKQWDDLKARGLVSSILSIPKVKKGKIKYLRVSEAGDFRSQRDVNKLNIIAKKLKAAGITTYCYTARQDLKFKGLAFIVNGSGFKVDNNFKAVKEHTPGAITCPGNCRGCNLCKVKHGQTIEVKYH